MKTIFLVRHGESAANAGLPTSDPSRIPLTARGQAQAEHVAMALDVRPALVVTSTYLRTADTARPYCQRHGIEAHAHELTHEFVTLDPDLVAGTTGLERLPLINEYWSIGDPARRAGSNAEQFLEFAGRVDGFARQLSNLPDQTVVFGHGMWFAMLIWRTMGFPVNTTQAMKAFRAFQIGLPMPNCCVYELQGVGDTWAVKFNAAVSTSMPSLAEQAYTIQ